MNWSRVEPNQPVSWEKASVPIRGERIKLSSGTEVEQETDRKLKDFLTDDSKDFSKSRARVIPPKAFVPSMLAVIPGYMLGGALVIGTAAVIGATYGGAAPIALPLHILGLGILAASNAAFLAGLAGKLRMSSFKEKVENSSLPPVTREQILKDVKVIKTKDAEMKLLALKIKHDQVLKPEMKEYLLKPYIGLKTTKKNVAELRAKYAELKYLVQLRQLFEKEFPSIDFSEIKANSFNDFYHKAVEKSGYPPFKEDLEKLSKSKRKAKATTMQDLHAKVHLTNDHFWIRLSNVYFESKKNKAK